MKLKKNVKKIIIVILVLLLITVGVFAYLKYNHKEETKEIKIVDNISKYGYKLKENKPEKYKTMFKEVKEILNKDEVSEEEYVKKISELYIYDFYSLKDKLAKTDIGGVDFVHKDILENYLQNAQDTYYKYVESNLYNNRKQDLPEVSEITIEEVEQKSFSYNETTDEKAYYVNVKWSYTEDEFSDYQNSATLVFVHDDIKLCLVELQ